MHTLSRLLFPLNIEYILMSSCSIIWPSIWTFPPIDQVWKGELSQCPRHSINLPSFSRSMPTTFSVILDAFVYCEFILIKASLQFFYLLRVFYRVVDSHLIFFKLLALIVSLLIFFVHHDVYLGVLSLYYWSLTIYYLEHPVDTDHLFFVYYLHAS